MTKENILEKSRKGLSIPINQLKGKYDNPSQLSNSDYNSNKELISSSIFKTIMSNLVTPSKKLNNKGGTKAQISGKVNLTKKDEPNFTKKPKSIILGNTNTNNTTSFNNNKTSSVYNINLNLNLNVNFNNSSKGSSNNTTLKNNALNSNNSHSKPRVNDINGVVNLKENKINIHENNIIKKINSPRREEFNIHSYSNKIETNELPLTDRIKSPKENLLKTSNDIKNNKTTEQANIQSKDSKGKINYNIKNYIVDNNKSSVSFVNKILNVKNNIPAQKTKKMGNQNFVKSITPVCTNNILNKLFKLNLDLKIVDGKNLPEKKKIETKAIIVVQEKKQTLQKKAKNVDSVQGIQIKNFDKIFDVKNYLSNNTTKTTKQRSDNRKKLPIKTEKK